MVQRKTSPGCSGKILWTVAFLMVWQTTVVNLNAQSPRNQQDLLKRLDQVVSRGIEQGTLVGAQVAVGTTRGVPRTKSYGVIEPRSTSAVNDETLFCIGSCSKPIAAACIVTLGDSGQLDFKQSINRWIPESNQWQVKNGQALNRPPNMLELLTHRGGIYSQKAGPMTAAQTRAIRDFGISLQDSVAIIQQQPLISQPGEQYAYSGAGYCLAGYVAEVVADKPFEELLQTCVCAPAGMQQTTYFPNLAKTTNIARPGTRDQNGQTVPHPDAPHLLGQKLKLPLIGGSLYSTASDTAAFAKLILNRGKSSRKQVMSLKAWQFMTSQQYPGQGYGLGWGLTIQNRRTTALQHNGALLGYRGLIHIDLKSNQYAVVYWTLSEERDPQGKQFLQAVQRTVR